MTESFPTDVAPAGQTVVHMMLIPGTIQRRLLFAALLEIFSPLAGAFKGSTLQAHAQSINATLVYTTVFSSVCRSVAILYWLCDLPGKSTDVRFLLILRFVRQPYCSSLYSSLHGVVVSHLSPGRHRHRTFPRDLSLCQSASSLQPTEAIVLGNLICQVY